MYCVCVCTHTHTHTRTHAHTHTHTHTHTRSEAEATQRRVGVLVVRLLTTTVSKETYNSVKRDLLQCQKRPGVGAADNDAAW
jgi:hypothetical protein